MSRRLGAAPLLAATLCCLVGCRSSATIRRPVPITPGHADPGSACGEEPGAGLESSFPIGSSLPEAPEEEVTGAATAVIDRTSPEYASLVPCAAGPSTCLVLPAVRRSLDTLRAQVLSKWPGTTVVVLCGLDLEYVHGTSSPHYEARSVELRLSDGDTEKLGTFAEFARDSGFDWVGRIAVDRIRATQRRVD
jgi:hypothetical protein